MTLYTKAFKYLKKKYPDHGRRLYLMPANQIIAIYYKTKLKENKQ